MTTPRSSNGGAGVGNGAQPVPQSNPEFTQGGAPAGPFITEGELPSIAVPGGAPATLNGYSPEPGRTPQVRTIDDPRGLTASRPPSGLAK